MEYWMGEKNLAFLDNPYDLALVVSDTPILHHSNTPDFIL